MSQEIEKEYTYLLKSLSPEILGWKNEFVADTYIPYNNENPQIRLRQRGVRYFITKKYPQVDGDLSTMIEETISLRREEYDYLKKHLPGKYLAKKRYSKRENGIIIEVDQYLEDLAPLVVMDIEWVDVPPEDSLVRKFPVIQEITQVSVLAAGKIAGKKYDEIIKHII